MRVLLGGGEGIERFVVMDLRLPRLTMGVLVGAAFGVAGAVFQTVLGNPLASPDILGINWGASLAAVAGLLLRGMGGPAVSFMAFGGALAVAAAIYALAWRGGVTGDRFVLIGLTGDKFVEVWDVSGASPKLARRIQTGNGAHSFRAWGDKRHVLVSNRAGNTISKIDLATLSVVDQYPAPAGPDDMELLTDGKTLLVTSRWAGKLTEIDTTTRKVVRQVKVGKSPHGLWTLDHKPRL